MKKKIKQTDVEVEGIDDEDMDNDPDEEPEEEPVVPKPEVGDRWYVGQVTTQTEPVIINKKKPDKPLTLYQAVVVILNKLQRLEKLL